MPDVHLDKELMTCMEVWGGNDLTDQSINLVGLDVFVYSKPYAEYSHGGDIYYVSSCATGRIIRLLLADISGHGAVVDKPAQALRLFMQRYINQIDQSRFVQAMNMALTKFAQGGIFATAVVATYFTPTRTMTLTNAGHPPPMIFEASKGEWSYLQRVVHDNEKFVDIPLGVLKLSDYGTLDIKLNKDDMILCYSDALIECKSEKGEFLGVTGLTEQLNQMSSTEPKDLIPTLIKHLSQLYVKNLEADDMTLMLFTPNQLFEINYEKPSLKNHWKMMKKLICKLMSKNEPSPWPDLHPANLGGALIKSLNRLWGRQIK